MSKYVCSTVTQRCECCALRKRGFVALMRRADTLDGRQEERMRLQQERVWLRMYCVSLPKVNQGQQHPELASCKSLVEVTSRVLCLDGSRAQYLSLPSVSKSRGRTVTSSASGAQISCQPQSRLPPTHGATDDFRRSPVGRSENATHPFRHAAHDRAELFAVFGRTSLTSSWVRFTAPYDTGDQNTSCKAVPESDKGVASSVHNLGPAQNNGHSCTLFPRS